MHTLASFPHHRAHTVHRDPYGNPRGPTGADFPSTPPSMLWVKPSRWHTLRSREIGPKAMCPKITRRPSAPDRYRTFDVLSTAPFLVARSPQFPKVAYFLIEISVRNLFNMVPRFTGAQHVANYTLPPSCHTGATR